jgi:hypothetical protein
VQPIHDNYAMAVDYIRYDILTQDALRGVVRTVLEDAARNGLPGEHHFYISFDPRADGVKLSQRMRAQYPEEMTIVLQHQFWDLQVTEDRFEVGLAFGGMSERVVVPFAAIKGFFDPSAQFGVQFEQFAQAEATEDGADAKGAEARNKKKPATTRPPAEQKKAAETSAPPTPANTPTEPPGEKPAAAPADGAEIVRLDRFRKK